MKRFTTNQLSSLQQTSGVYFFKNAGGVIVYIGKAINLRNRVESYFKPNILIARTRELVKHIKSIEIIRTESEFEALLLEAKLINKHKPKYNAIAKDDKHPLYIKISRERFPKISTSRREDENTATYFGPFPASKVIADTLKYLRTIFPYCTERKIGKKPCFYAHIKLCSPCPNSIVQLPSKEKSRQTKMYRANVLHIKQILSGKYKLVAQLLTKEMRELARAMRFEEAAQVKRKIDKLNYLTQPHQSINSYLANPNLYEDLRNEELRALAALLGIPTPRRIEGYDISNTQGSNATASMVVFTDAQATASEYRRFKIQRTRKPNDIAMMTEVLTRRFAHIEWDYPNLILIDGGEGQVGAGVKIVANLAKPIPLIGLTKRFEEIIVPKKTNDAIFFHRLHITRHSPGLKLLQRVRDESHRFAKKYHLAIRNKSVLY